MGSARPRYCPGWVPRVCPKQRYWGSGHVKAHSRGELGPPRELTAHVQREGYMWHTQRVAG